MFKNNVFIIIAIAGLFCSVQANGQAESAGWKEEGNVYEKVYDAALLGDSLNENSTIHQIVHQNPVILALVFTRCAGVCNPFLLQLKENLQMVSNPKKFNIVVISFDPRDTQKDMDLLAKRFDLNADKKWIFAITDSIQRLNQSIGFNPVWDSTRQQFDHEALLVGINTDGYITKKLIGVRDNQALSQLVSSIHNSFSPTYRLPNPNMLFSCFNYNSKTGKNTPGLGLLFIALPSVVTLLILFSTNYFVRSER